MKESEDIRIIQLFDKANNDSTLYRLKQGNILQFRLGHNLHGFSIDFYTNHPIEESKLFSRKSFSKLAWNNTEFDDSSYVNLKIVTSGSFQFKYLKDGNESGRGYFLVDPKIILNKKEINLDSICLITVLPKLLGSFNEWRGRLEVCAKTGYNFIHFTPIQELGASNSSYSIKNQLALNSEFGQNVSFDDIEKLINFMEKEWGVLSICDLVLNHTANETPWLFTNPECGYNLKNCPHLRPAYLLDKLLKHISHEVSLGIYENRGVPKNVNLEEHLSSLREIYKEKIKILKLEEFWILDIEKIIEEFKQFKPKNLNQDETIINPDIKIIQDAQFRRLNSTIDLSVAFYLYNSHNDPVNALRSRLNSFNEEIINIIQNHLAAAIENVIAGARYERIQFDGPRISTVSSNHPLSIEYFIELKNHNSLSNFDLNEIETKSFEFGEFILSHNGWVMNDNALSNFADKDSNVYLRREIIVWGDSVKLRYGENENDCPFLWDEMKKYAQQTAKIFHGIRLDNCHSTPIEVAEYILDSAREIRPNLYLIAELFTNSDATDNIFVNRLGINSLIREALSAWDSHEEGRLVHRYGGNSVGSFKNLGSIKLMTPSIAHAIFLDQSHDNPSHVEKRSLYDQVPTAALVSMASCANGSNRGFDELVAHHIHVVNEARLYKSWSEENENKNTTVGLDTGIIKIKKSLNEFHIHLGENGFNEIFVDQMESDIVAVTRHNPITHESYIMVSFTAFVNPSEDFFRDFVKELKVEGVVSEVVIEASIQLDKDKRFKRPDNFEKDEKYINGIQPEYLHFQQNISIENSRFINVESFDSDSIIKFKDFHPGSIICLKILPNLKTKGAFTDLNDIFTKEKLISIVDQLNLGDMNRVLFRSKEEEEDDQFGYSTYNVPNFGSLKYCGLSGILNVLSKIRTNNDLGHPFCNNLREGDWLMEYTSGRLMNFENTKDLGNFLSKCFNCIKNMPRYLIPSYFDLIVTTTYEICLDRVFSLMNCFVNDGSDFVKMLAMNSVICSGFAKSAPMPNPNHISLCAGLPHFSTNYMRNWGRDTFISLPGLFLTTGRFKEAEEIIISYASVLRHGLIPNLLDRGTNSRYNCRDATWFWLESIKKYMEYSKGKENIFKKKVYRMYPTDDSEPVLDNSQVQKLEDVIQETVQKHFEGISFRERSAGHKIDAHMTDSGFNIKVWVDENTGFIHGGNSYNCGTWMDKMGSSEKAQTKGLPATPRDGAAVEIIGLSFSVLKFLSEEHSKGNFSYNYVKRESNDGNIITWTFKKWYETIRNNFESHFWIGEENKEDKNNPKLINRKNIYKDTFGSSVKYSDYQLRPNFPIAIAVAPQLFDANNAKLALKNYENILLSHLGCKTLDPSDWNYFGDYSNSDDSDNPKIAHGFNYHNGPEWLWPVGYYLLSCIIIGEKLGQNEKLKAILHSKRVLSKFYNYLINSEWKGLPELTNSNGSFCSGSCEVQAWSAGTILEVLKLLKT